MRLPRTIRFDASDERVFERAAAPDEIAISGAFLFADAEPEDITGKQRQALRHGFLGLASFGWSSFACVAEVSDADCAAAEALLAHRFFAEFGAPDIETARSAARDEIAHAAGLCDHPVNTVIAVERELSEEGVRERYRIVTPARERDHAKVWDAAEALSDKGAPHG